METTPPLPEVAWRNTPRSWQVGFRVLIKCTPVEGQFQMRTLLRVSSTGSVVLTRCNAEPAPKTRISPRPLHNIYGVLPSDERLMNHSRFGRECDEESSSLMISIAFAFSQTCKSRHGKQQSSGRCKKLLMSPLWENTREDRNEEEEVANFGMILGHFGWITSRPSVKSFMIADAVYEYGVLVVNLCIMYVVVMNFRIEFGSTPRHSSHTHRTFSILLLLLTSHLF